MRNWNLHLVEQAFAEAATNFDAWGSALGILAEQTGSHGALLFNAAGKPFQVCRCRIVWASLPKTIFAMAGICGTSAFEVCPR